LQSNLKEQLERRQGKRQRKMSPKDVTRRGEMASKEEEKIELDRKKNRTPWYNVYFEEQGVEATKKQMQKAENE
jgi:hypothetical protein